MRQTFRVFVFIGLITSGMAAHAGVSESWFDLIVTPAPPKSNYTLQIHAVFYTYAGEPTEEWPIKTRVNTPVNFSIRTEVRDARYGILTADFTQEHMDDINWMTESSSPVLSGKRVASPSIKYNCHALAILRNDVWIGNVALVQFMDDGHFGRTSQPTDGGIATHGTAHSTAFTNYVYLGQFLGTPLYTYDYVGKYGTTGVYRTTRGVVEQVYNLPSHATWHFRRW